MRTQSTFADILSARRAISPYVSRTPLRHYPSLSDTLGAEVYLKHENYQVTGAFKVRAGSIWYPGSPKRTKLGGSSVPRR